MTSKSLKKEEGAFKIDGEDLKENAYEEEHVHAVYQQIASHFSSTRYKVRSIAMFKAISPHLQGFDEAD